MRHIKPYSQLLESQTELTPEQIEWLDKCTRGRWTLNPQTGLVDVNGIFHCYNRRLTDFKGVRFGEVTGSFDCSFSRLTSLDGAPQKVGGDFICHKNNLTSLEGAPHRVGRSFSCTHNKLTSLEGAPRKVGVSFDCSDNQLISLEGAPQEVLGNFFCNNNDLISLEGAPQVVGRDFVCHSNPVRESVLKALYQRMESGMSWPDAVASQWRYIRSDEDKILLAPSNPTLSPEQIRGYEALARLKRRVI